MMYVWDPLTKGESVVSEVMSLDRFLVPELQVSGEQPQSLSSLSSKVISGPCPQESLRLNWSTKEILQRRVIW